MDEQIAVSYVPLWGKYLSKFEDAQLDDRQLGKLVRAMMEYQFRGVLPTKLDRGLKVFWMFMQDDMDNARVKYETSVRNGRKGGRKKASEEPQGNPEEPELTQAIPEEGITRTNARTRTNTRTHTRTKQAAGEQAAQEMCVSEKAYGEFGWVKLTQEQHRKLCGSMGTEELQRCITYIDRCAQTSNNRNHWKDWYLLLQRCHENRWYDAEQRHSQNQDVPTGATGHLGEAELEAIRRTLAWEPPEDLPALAME